MKRIAKYFIILLSLILVIFVAYGIINSNDAELVLNEKIYPIIVGIIGAVTSIYTVLKPLISKMNLSTDNFDQCINYSKSILDNSEEYKKEILQMYKKIEEMKSELDATLIILKTAFSNTAELVKNGTASLINKVGEKDEL